MKFTASAALFQAGIERTMPRSRLIGRLRGMNVFSAASPTQAWRSPPSGENSQERREGLSVRQRQQPRAMAQSPLRPPPLRAETEPDPPSARRSQRPRADDFVLKKSNKIDYVF